MGIYQVGIGAFPPRDQDPKSLIPMTWMGELWRFPVMLLTLLSYVVLPALAVLALVFIFGGGSWLLLALPRVVRVSHCFSCSPFHQITSHG